MDTYLRKTQLQMKNALSLTSIFFEKDGHLPNQEAKNTDLSFVKCLFHLIFGFNPFFTKILLAVSSENLLLDCIFGSRHLRAKGFNKVPNFFWIPVSGKGVFKRWKRQRFFYLEILPLRMLTNNTKATCDRVKPLAPGVIMARAVDKLKGDTIKFCFFSFLSSLYRLLLNLFEA